MKIIYKSGDLFKSDVKLLVHGCNAQGVMGSGVAKIVREQYPEAYKKYQRVYDTFAKQDLSLPMGSVIFAETNGKIIANAITQEFFGSGPQRYVSYDAMSDVMFDINRYMKQYDISSVVMPKIGAGLGGGSWDIISSIIESEIVHGQPIVYEL